MADESRQIGLNSLEAFAKQRLLKGASACKLKIGGHGVLNRWMWNLTHQLTAQKVFLIIFTLMLGVLPRLHHLDAIDTLSSLLMIYLGNVGYTLWDKKLRSNICWWSGRIWWRNRRLRCFKSITFGKYNDQFLQFGWKNMIDIHFKIGKHEVAKEINRT